MQIISDTMEMKEHLLNDACDTRICKVLRTVTTIEGFIHLSPHHSINIRQPHLLQFNTPRFQNLGRQAAGKTEGY